MLVVEKLMSKCFVAEDGTRGNDGRQPAQMVEAKGHGSRRRAEAVTQAVDDMGIRCHGLSNLPIGKKRIPGRSRGALFQYRFARDMRAPSFRVFGLALCGANSPFTAQT